MDAVTKNGCRLLGNLSGGYIKIYIYSRNYIKNVCIVEIISWT